jgi:phosphatidylserine/phosphatidylglycerophosphate/cardiolipin synthase-like enzyme
MILPAGAHLMKTRLLIALMLMLLVACEPTLDEPFPGAESTLNTQPTLPAAQPTRRPTTAPLLTATAFPVTSTRPPAVDTPLQQGFGAQKGFWQVFFTAPTGSRDRSTYVGGIDTQLADAIAAAERTLDIAAFEFNNVVLTQAVLDAAARGVVVRMVVDDVHGRNDDNTTIGQFISAGIEVVDDARSALMHNKFMIIDSATVWMGSYNFTVNDTYRNNNNLLALTSRRVVQNFQNEFNKMFERRQFGSGKAADTPFPRFTQDGVPIQVLFAPEDRIVSAIAVMTSQAQRSIRFMAFSFTLDDVAGIMQQKAADGILIEGIFETTGSETRASELRPLFCSGLNVRQDGNPFVLHHKVFIIDETTVITGSFNFSSGARDDNDENLIVITDPDLALQYLEEFNRRMAESRAPSITC